MKAVELLGTIDEQHQLQVQTPPSLPPGPVRILVLMPAAEEDDVEAVWMQGVSQEWQAELSDPREDIYTMQDGKPVDESR